MIYLGINFKLINLLNGLKILKKMKKVLLICGPPGIGKTSFMLY